MWTVPKDDKTVPLGLCGLVVEVDLQEYLRKLRKSIKWPSVTMREIINDRLKGCRN